MKSYYMVPVFPNAVPEIHRWMRQTVLRHTILHEYQTQNSFGA